MGYKRGHFVLIAKIIISALGYLMLGTFIYVLIIDGSTYNANCNSKCSYIVVNAHRCMIATTTDFYFCIVIVAVWIAYKESRWISAFFWILSLLSFWRLQRWDDALKAYTAKSAQATSQRLILDATLDNIYHLYAGILVIVFVIVDIRSQELSEQGFNISLKKV
uniref:Uncharacterized protein n=1 Tax=Lactuca sativa TaxID=4236 RepID=A0A9R1URT9_LACSA|nr:hypothetical protein LSAT_V11C800433810 [Lactuca sativa]